MAERSYPVSEVFLSPQGEGLYTGAMFAFIRLAGCTVGRKYSKEFYLPNPHGLGVPIYTEECTLFDGRKFPCDTDYRANLGKMTVEQIMEAVPDNIEHICITGGEPFMHDLEPLIDGFLGSQLLDKIHIETSGTLPLSKAFPTYVTGSRSGLLDDLWITVSPKINPLVDMINRADELKLLVDENFSVDKLTDEMMAHPLVYIQPVNFEKTVNPANLRRVMELQKRFPHWHVSLQLHKVLSHYLDEEVR